MLMRRRYITMGTLSLYMFNLLPLPHLDGKELLSNVLEVTVYDEGREYDVEAMMEGSESRRRWKGLLNEWIPKGTMGICMCYVVVGIMNSWR